jgi:hypothetical protein
MNEAVQTVSASIKISALPDVSAGSRWGAVLSALGLLLLLYLVTAISSQYRNPWKLVEGADGQASTSKFQWFLWVMAVLFAYTALWVLRAEQGDLLAVRTAPAGHVITSS